jgi:uncharacterized protein (UPF0264 family)
LVSVRDASELQQALQFGVDVLDLKEPRQGPLAPVDVKFWSQAVELLSETASVAGVSMPTDSAVHGVLATPKLSAALGERVDALSIAAKLPPQFAFAKVGPSGCRTNGAIRKLWSDVASELHHNVELVAVAYADAMAAQCLEPEMILVDAKRAGMGRCLVDTFSKDGRSSLQLLGVERLAQFDRLAKNLGMWWALAGSLTRDDVRSLTESGILPDCFAVRGDVCEQDRTGTICRLRMRAWRELFACPV